MSNRMWSRPALAGLAPNALLAGFTLAGPAFAQIDHYVGVAPKADPSVAVLPGGNAFSLPGIGEDFVFLTGGQFLELPSGQGRVIGVLARLSDPDQRFAADLVLGNRVDPGDPVYPPAASPLLELHPSAYTPNGGVVDPNGWHFWTNITGTLHGLGDFRGAKLTLGGRGPAFQCGGGANGRNTISGASGLVRATTVSQPASAPAFPAVVDGDAHMDLRTAFAVDAQNAVSDPTVAQHISSHAMWISGLGENYVFVAGGQLIEQASGDGKLTGVLECVTDPAKKFFVDVDFTTRVNPGTAGYTPPGSPKIELQPFAYVAGGGPVDTDSWYYYESFAGTVTGLDALAGAQYVVTRRGPAFQVGVGANGKNLAWGGSGWLDLTLAYGPQQSNLPQTLIGDFNLDFGGEESECTNKADALQGVGQLGGHALYIAGLGDDFVFLPGGRFNEFGDGTATLQGIVARNADPSQRFQVDVEFTGRLDATDVGFFPPAGSPKLELVPNAYVHNGGAPIDTNAWHYYETTQGTLTGLQTFAGAVYDITRMGPAFQVGLGANGKNINYGGSGWLTVTLLAPATNGANLPSGIQGDFNLDFSDDCPNCVRNAFNDAQATYTAGSHAFYLPGIGANMVFAPGARMVEFDDGTAHLTGTIYRARVPAKRFDVDVWFSNRVDPGAPGFAPSGSPKLELYDWMYAANGGPIDPSTWHYYLDFHGTLSGRRAMAGACLTFDRMGPAFQVGLGASGKNLDYGGSGWINVRTITQPTNFPALPDTLVGDINLNVIEGCQ